MITQNVDNLHQVSGVPDGKVVELHGNATYAKCLSCHDRIELVRIEQEFTTTGTVAPCRCGGIIYTTNVVSCRQ